MDLDLSSEQQDALDAFRRLLEHRSRPEHVRAAEPGGFDAGLWSEAFGMGIATMGILDEGDSQPALLDLALMAEVYGEYLAPIPFVEANVAARLLARCGPAGLEVLGPVKSRGAVATLALTDRAAPRRQPVPAGAIADVVVMLEGDRLLALTGTPPKSALRNLGTSPLAFRSADEPGATTRVLAEGPAARDLFERAVNEWRALTAAALTGLGAKALNLGVAYAGARKAFGVVIGKYQGVAHPLADAATSLDGARLLARSAAAAADEPAAVDETAAGEADRFGVLAAMALAFCAEAAQRTAAASLHVHGGYGFTLEYDVQLYLRRAKAWPLALGDPRKEYQRIAAMLFSKRGVMEKWIFG